MRKLLDRVYTSYFYKIRFFKPYMLPLSTAISDPKWFHLNKYKDYMYLDKNGVLNGCRMELLHPDSTCSNLCRGPEACDVKNPTMCSFIRNYEKQLDKIKFQSFMSMLEATLITYKEYMKLDVEPIPVFIVHEAPYNPCSERASIQKWFTKNGVPCSELEIS